MVTSFQAVLGSMHASKTEEHIPVDSIKAVLERLNIRIKPSI